MTVTGANENDLEAILALQYIAFADEAELFPNADIPPLKQTLAELKREYEQGTVLKACECEKIVGSVRVSPANGTVYIGKLIVDPEWRRRGIGTKLLSEVERLFPCMRYELFTSTRSERNIKFYERLGYKPYKEKKIDSELSFVFLEKRP